MLVLVPSPHECIGVDLDSGALVRALVPAGSGLMPYDVASAGVADDGDGDELAPPETVSLATSARHLGRLTGRRAERYLRPLLHPRRTPLLGFSGPAVPYWSLCRDRPTVSIVEPRVGPDVFASDSGLRCRFGWHSHLHDLPLDARPCSASRLQAGGLRLVVALSAPRDGYCYKIVAGILPRP
jgi:hypothetical protein